MKLTITIYGGANTIGGNQILLEDEGGALFFDFGIVIYKKTDKEHGR